jgi:hypothetical protein
MQEWEMKTTMKMKMMTKNQTEQHEDNTEQNNKVAREQATADADTQVPTTQQNNKTPIPTRETHGVVGRRQCKQPSVQTVNEDDKEADEGPRRAGLRRNRRRDYPHLKGHENDGSLPTIARPDEFGKRSRHYANLVLQSIIMTQYNLQEGIKKIGERGKEAVMVKMQQLHDQQVGKSVNPATLSWSEKKSTVQYLMFLKEKVTGQIKDRGCANRRSQREYLTKEETTALTVVTELLFISCAIDAYEKREVAVVDLPGAFMQVSVEDEIIHVKLEGVMCEIMTKLDPKLYKKYVVYKKGKPVLYMKLSKPLYGTIQAALRFWEDLSRKLQEGGFELNPYDFCIANKTINGKQCTILWHVDNLKISHRSAKVVSNIIDKLDRTYRQEIVGGKRANLTISRGKAHNYLGMKLDYRKPGACKKT